MSKAAMRREKEYEKLGQQYVYATGTPEDSTPKLSKCRVCLKKNCLVRKKICNECRAEFVHRDQLAEFDRLLELG